MLVEATNTLMFYSLSLFTRAGGKSIMFKEHKHNTINQNDNKTIVYKTIS